MRTLSRVSDLCGFVICLAGLTAELQDIVTKTIRSPPINSGIKYDRPLLMHTSKDIVGFSCHRSVSSGDSILCFSLNQPLLVLGRGAVAS